MNIVYTGGTFDLFHIGHVQLLRQCKKIAGSHGKVVVALNSDEFIKSCKGKFPACNYEERKGVLLSCRYVDEVVLNTYGIDSRPTILSVDPDFIVVGSDWAKKDYYSQMMFDQKWLDYQNISLVYVVYTDDISSSIIKKRMNTGNKNR